MASTSTIPAPAPAAFTIDDHVERSDRYLRWLLPLLVSAAFFDGYDGSILGLLLPQIQRSFHLSESTLGATRLSALFGAVVGFLLARSSDRVGRRPVLVWSVVGYTVFTALTALSWSFGTFVLFQFGAGIFIGPELAVTITVIVEEFPTARRGRALGKLLAFNSHCSSSWHTAWAPSATSPVAGAWNASAGGRPRWSGSRPGWAAPSCCSRRPTPS